MYPNLVSKVSPQKLSHDSVSRWLKESKCRSSDVWQVSKSDILGSPRVIIADDTVIQKNHSKKAKLPMNLVLVEKHFISI